MRKITVQPLSLCVLLMSSLMLTACGGGGGSTSSVPPAAAAVVPAPAPAPTTVVTPPPPPAQATTVIGATTAPPAVTTPPIATLPPPDTSGTVQQPPVAGTVTPTAPIAPVAPLDTSVPVTTITLESTGSAEQLNVPVTFGQVFAVGHIGPSQTVTAKLMADSTSVPLQVDIKARHPDGSVRHAILSAQVPKVAVGQSQSIGLSAAAAPAAPAATTPATLLDAGFTTSVNVTIDGQVYTASADQLLRTGNYETWLSGPVVNEWLVSAPLATSAGVAHPHLAARFSIRAVKGEKRARVDVTVENNWAYEMAPQNFKYDAQVLVGGSSVYNALGMTHYHHSRWRKMFWWGAQPSVHIKHNVAYLIATKALPNYDQTVVVPETRLAAMKTAYAGARIEPMGVGSALYAMPTTGGRDDIGLLPAWGATYLLSMDRRAKEVTLGTADLAGSWSSHYRDKNTGRPVSLADYPYMTILGNRTDTMNPVTKKLEAFPLCATTTSCTTPNNHDTSHQPAFAYLPYLVTGDFYYLEELQFWAMFNSFSSNPGYRENIKGLVRSDQVRGQAWSLRTIGEAAYITPDADKLKPQLMNLVKHNLDYFNATYTNNAAANKLGVITNGYSVVYNNSTGLAPWMDDFFTSAIGHLNELGFTSARPLLEWKARFPIGRMIDPGTCWITGAMYSMKVRDSATAPLYISIGEAWKASSTPEFAALACGSQAMATNLGLKVGEMTGYSAVATGYPSNMQPALAYAADVGGSPGASAWTVFSARTVKPNYGLGPQFAIVPR